MARKDAKTGREGSPKRETYRGREIVVQPAEADHRRAAVAQEGADRDLLRVEIDGRPIEVLQEGPNSFYSVQLPYQSYASPMELARAVVDHVPSFKPEGPG